MDTRKDNSNNSTQKSKSAPEQFFKFIDYDKPIMEERAKNALIKLTRPKIDYSEIITTPEGGILILGGHLTKETLEELREKYPNKELTEVAILNQFEVTSATGVKPLTPIESEREGIHQRSYCMIDNAGPNNRDAIHPLNIISAAKDTDDALRKGHIVYVHCKSGKGRSVLAVTNYIALYSDVEPIKTMRNTKQSVHEILQKTISFIRSKRKGIDLHEEYIDGFDNAKDQWKKLTSDPYGLESEVQAKYGKKKNIGKIIKARDAYLEKDKFDSNLSSTDYSYTSTHFFLDLTQSYAFKFLITYFVLVDKYALATDTLIAKQKFCDLLKNDPAEAVHQLKSYIEGNADNNNVISNLIATAERDNCNELRITVFGDEKYNINHIMAKLYHQIKQYDYAHDISAKTTSTVTIPNQINDEITTLKLIVEQYKNDNSEKYKLLFLCINQLEMDILNDLNSPLINNLTIACQELQKYQNSIKYTRTLEESKIARESLSNQLKKCGIIGELFDNSKVVGGKYDLVGIGHGEIDKYIVPALFRLQNQIAYQKAQVSQATLTTTSNATVTTTATTTTSTITAMLNSTASAVSLTLSPANTSPLPPASTTNTNNLNANSSSTAQQITGQPTTNAPQPQRPTTATPPRPTHSASEPQHPPKSAPLRPTTSAPVQSNRDAISKPPSPRKN